METTSEIVVIVQKLTVGPRSDVQVIFITCLIRNNRDWNADFCIRAKFRINTFFITFGTWGIDNMISSRFGVGWSISISSANNCNVSGN